MTSETNGFLNVCAKCTVVGIVALAAVTAATLIWVFML